MTFLHVASGEGGERILDAGCADAVFLHELRCKIADGARLQYAAAGEWRRVISVGNDVIRDGALLGAAGLQAVFGDMGHAAFSARAHVGMCKLFSQHGDAARFGAQHAGEQLHQLGLPVAFHTGDPEDFAAADGQADVPDCWQSAFVVAAQVLRLQHHLARGKRLAGQIVVHDASYHHRGQVSFGSVRRIGPAGHLPFAHDRDFGGDGQDLFNLCVLKMMEQPSAFSLCRMAISSCVSCGVKTAVGSSRMRIFTSRYRP